METTNDRSTSKIACPSKNINRLLEMLDNTSAFTEQEIRNIINSDEEAREAYHLMVAAKQGYRYMQSNQTVDAEAAWQRFEQKCMPRQQRFDWMKIAAMFIGILLITSIAIAAIHIIQSRSGKPMESFADTTSQLSTHNPQLEETYFRFSNTPLDSVLSVVSAHYGHAVCFRNDTLRQLRFTIGWDNSQPLSTFLNDVNEFEGLQLVDARDTIFVNAEKEVHP